MKSFLVIIISFTIITPFLSQQDLLVSYPKEISYRGDAAYFNGYPFTGLLVDEKSNNHLGVFKNGYKNGIFTEFFNSGKKKAEVNYLMGVKNGVETEWDVDGQKVKEASVKNGSLNGILREWNPNGSLKTEIQYDNGNIVDGDYSI